MPDYSKGKIYKIVCHKTGLTYVGSTTKSLSRRLSSHKCDFKRFQNMKRRHLTSFKVLDAGCFDIELIEEFPCPSRTELQAREAYHIKSLDCVNKMMKQSLEDMREKYKAKLMTTEQCVCGCLVVHGNMGRHLKTSKHLQYIEMQNEGGFENNVRSKTFVKEQCECGALIGHGQMLRHKRSKRHVKAMNMIQANTCEVKHYASIETKAQCECGCLVRDSNMIRHKKTAKHIELMKQLMSKETNPAD